MISNPIPVTLIGGYLGSGKTTLINHLLNQEHNQRIAVLVNDFGELAIDAALIEAERDNIISLSGGCVCCSYGNDLSNALLDIMAMETVPDQIVIEASGVAMPGAIASSVSLMQQLFVHGIIILANAELIHEQAHNKYVADTIDRQLSSADLLVLNKIDLVDSNQLVTLKNWLTTHYPHTKTVCVAQAQLPVSIILNAFIPESINDTKHIQSSIDITDVTIGSDARQSEPSSSSLTHASLFNTFKIDASSACDAKALATILASEKAQLVRAKGFILDRDSSTKLLQIVGRRWTLTAAPTETVRTVGLGIVCIGLAHSTKASDIVLLVQQYTNADVAS